MKKYNLKCWALLLSIAFLLAGCGSESEETVETETNNTVNVEQSEVVSLDPAEPFSFEELKTLNFVFSSGAGAWSTELVINEDGHFEGYYHDTDMGDSGKEYPNGTVYRCDFTGKFTEPVKVNDYTYSMKLKELQYEREAGTEEILDGMLFHYSAAYGLENADNVLIYLPSAPLAELPEGYRSWVGFYNIDRMESSELGFYGLYNEDEQYGFSSYDIVISMNQMLLYTEEIGAQLEESLTNDPLLNQAELNEKAQELYTVWDNALNSVWDVLKRTLDAEKMNELLQEQREWISMKEAEGEKLAEKYDGGSITALLVYHKKAELTKERVYELVKYLE